MTSERATWILPLLAAVLPPLAAVLLFFALDDENPWFVGQPPPCVKESDLIFEGDGPYGEVRLYRFGPQAKPDHHYDGDGCPMDKRPPRNAATLPRREV